MQKVTKVKMKGMKREDVERVGVIVQLIEADDNGC